MATYMCTNCGNVREYRAPSWCNACRLVTTNKRYADAVEKGVCPICYKEPSRFGRNSCVECAKKRTKQVVRKRRETKEKAIELLGGACADCGLRSRYVEVYDFHHPDPNKKEYSPGQYLHYSWEFVKKEIEKCTLLCANCHRTRHATVIA